MAGNDAPAERWFDAAGVNVHGLEWNRAAGDAPVLLMLHGISGNAWHWNALAPLLRDRLGDRYRLVSLDQRGHGDSDKPVEGHELEHTAKDVLAVHRQYGERPLVLVGHSRGGWLAAYVAARWPALVTHLVLVDPARLAYDSTADADRFYGRVRSLLGPFPSPEAALRAFHEDSPDANWSRERDESVAKGLEQQADGTWANKLPAPVLDALRAVREREDWVGDLLGDIVAPTLLLVALKASAERIDQKLEYARRIPHADTRALDTTHYMAHDEPERVASIMSEFLSEQRT